MDSDAAISFGFGNAIMGAILQDQGSSDFGAMVEDIESAVEQSEQDWPREPTVWTPHKRCLAKGWLYHVTSAAEPRLCTTISVPGLTHRCRCGRIIWDERIRK